MRGDQREQVRKAAGDVGGAVGETVAKEFAQLSNDVLAQKLIPKNAMGFTDAMMEGLYSQAYRLYNTGRYKDAIQLFRLLIMLNSTEAKYSMGLAACFHMLKEYQSAVTTYALCGVIDPNSPVPHYHASDCYIQMNDPISAIISLEMAVKRAGDKPEYQSLKDRALISIENLKKEAKASALPADLFGAEKKVKKKKK